MEEEWKDVVGYEDYYMVSSLGRIMSKPRLCLGRAGKYRMYEGRILKPRTYKDGYVRLTLSIVGLHIHQTVHRIVAAAFLGLDYDSKLCVDHLNGIKNDNRLSNIDVVTYRENTTRCFVKKGTISGKTGVFPLRNKWMSYIRYGKEYICLGSFLDKNEAYKYYVDAVYSIENGLPVKVHRRKCSSDYEGIGWHKATQKWSARVRLGNKRIHLGCFNSEEDAYLARKKYLENMSVENNSQVALFKN